MKVWARYSVPVMVLVDADQDEIERIVMVLGERDLGRHPDAPDRPEWRPGPIEY